LSVAPAMLDSGRARLSPSGVTFLTAWDVVCGYAPLRMRKLPQVVAVLVVAVLAVQPALASFACPIASECPMMGAMGPDCPMMHSIGADMCAPDCCDHATLVVGTDRAPFDVRKMVPEQAISATLVKAPTAAACLPSPVRRLSVSHAPPRYIILQVFRI
jgi:hypothetical protein